MRFNTVLLSATLLGLCWITPEVAAAQMASADEIIVTGTRLSRAKSINNNGGAPGISYIRRGDFMLLQVQIESDARETTERLSELETTIQASPTLLVRNMSQSSKD